MKDLIDGKDLWLRTHVVGVEVYAMVTGYES